MTVFCNRNAAALVLALVIAAVFWLLAPALGGYFVADDFVFLATSRIVEQPLATFWQHHFYEPVYFRPVGQLSWWLALQAFGLDYGKHALINVALHALNGVSLWLLLRRLALPSWSALAGASFFILLPTSFIASAWPSNRFDLLAVFFLLWQAIFMVRYLSHREGGGGVLLAAAACALLACWSKELAYPLATGLAFVTLCARAADLSRRLLLFAVLGVAISAAFFWRQYLLPQAYGVAGASDLSAFLMGVWSQVKGLPSLAMRLMGTELPAHLQRVAGLGAVVAVLAVFAVLGLSCRRVECGRERFALALGVAALGLILLLVQAPLARAFAGSVEWGVFGEVTYARFFYAPAVLLALLLALLLSVWRRVWPGVLMIGAAFAIAVLSRPSSERFADWTQREIRPVSEAALALIRATSTAPGECLNVIFGTQTVTPMFRMFADVTPKALMASDEPGWRCQMMTETTPWIFIFREGEQAASTGLVEIRDDARQAKADSVWSGVRYRYRVPPASWAELPQARFYQWDGRGLTEVTAQVRSGAWAVQPAQWW